jgi:hypothetical protein
MHKYKNFGLGLSLMAATFCFVSVLFFGSTPAHALTDSEIQAKGVAACGKNEQLNPKDYAAFAKTTQGKACVDAFVIIYKDASQTTFDNVCAGKTGSAQAGCLIGRTLGKQAREADQASNGSGGGSTLSDAQIKAIASNDNACQVGSSALKNACIAGFVAGYKGQSNNVCNSSSYSSLEQTKCKDGYSAGQAAKSSGITQANPTDPTVLSGAKDACKEYDPNAKPRPDTANQTYFNNCINGYAAGNTGKSQKEACEDGFVSGSDSQKACLVGFSAATSIDEDSQSKCLNASATSLLTFGWIACPVLSGIDNFIKVTNNVIEDQLNFKVSKYLNADVHKSWTIMRDIATSLLVIIMLVIVLSQAIGSSVFDAYTLRKTLPKLVIAVVVMQISWEFAIWLINIANDVGQGVKDLMFAPFGGGSNMSLEALVSKLGDAAPGVTVGAIFTGLILATTVGGLTIIGIGMLALGALLSALVGLLVLLLRQVLIILCVILAPIALVLWILPGTQRYWKLWSDNFSRLLILFPIVMGIIAAGRIFAYITANASTSADAILAVFGVMAGFFGPYWFLPKAFQWGGSAMSAIASNTGRLTKPVREAPRKFIGNQAKINREQRAKDRNWRLAEGQSRFPRFDKTLAGGYNMALNRRAREKLTVHKVEKPARNL